MKKTFSLWIALVMMISLVTTTVSAAQTVADTPTPELGQLKLCKVAGFGVTVGQLFTIKVGNTSYEVPAGPPDGGYCVLAGQFPLGTQLTIQEVIPAGYFVSRIEVKPDRVVSKDTAQGKVVIKIGSGVTEVIFTNKIVGAPTPSVTTTPKPTRTPTSTPSCAPNCTPTPTPIPKGRLQICKEADGPGVSGSFTFNFAGKSTTIPVGACTPLITVDAGTLTITEVARTGYVVSDVYTIPVDRLLSKDLKARRATVTIVEGTASSQTIVVFRNRTEGTPTPTFTPTNTATFTPTVTGTLPTHTPTVTGTPPTPTATNTATLTPTFTPTGSVTPTACPPILITADFSQITSGASIEGMDVVAPFLNIDAKGTAAKIAQGAQPFVYVATGTGTSIINGGIAPNGGFSDVTTQQASQAHLYTFTFAPWISASDFSLHMLDYGDLNPTLSTNHYVSMTAFGANGAIIDKQELVYITPAEALPSSSDRYGDLRISGDATGAVPGQPGNWTWHMSGSGIVKVVLEFGAGFDPNIGFDTLTFDKECHVCQPSTGTVDLSQIANGASIEGPGVVAPFLNIDAKGTAVKIAQSAQPFVYAATGTGTSIINGGIAPNGGFSDVTTQQASQAHLYTFTFAPWIFGSDFSLHMLDYGDLNPTLSTNHYVSMTAFGANSALSKQELSYTTPAEALPSSSDRYGDLRISGDATGAVPGQPGNWTWHVSASGIVQVVLEFGAGFDPNIGFDTLTVTTVCR